MRLIPRRDWRAKIASRLSLDYEELASFTKYHIEEDKTLEECSLRKILKTAE